MSDKTLYSIVGAIILIGAVSLIYLGTRDKGYVPSWGEHQGRLDALDQKMKSTLAEIQGAHGEGKCETTSQCRVVGLGAKTCGGYNNFLIYSTRDADEPTLLDLVRKFNEAADEFNKTSLQAAPCGQQAKAMVCVHEECTPR